jgi:two-component system sensor histidine kinase/response regulator
LTAPDQEVAITSEELPSRRPLIIILDHEPAYLRLMTTLLTQEGYGALPCNMSNTAHDLISSAQPDLVLLDTWVENRESGWAVLQTMFLDERTAHIPILIASSDKEGFEERAQQIDGRAVEVIYKPFDPPMILSAIRRLIGPPLSAK